jgi:hypothetical protein
MTLAALPALSRNVEEDGEIFRFFFYFEICRTLNSETAPGNPPAQEPAFHTF